MVIQTEAPALRVEADGAIRIGNSRVLLEIVIWAFENGSTPEAIARDYSTVSLGEVYAVIGYYLRHKQEVEAYLQLREQQAEEVRQKIDARQGDLSEKLDVIRARLRART